MDVTDAGKIKPKVMSEIDIIVLKASNTHIHTANSNINKCCSPFVDVTKVLFHVLLAPHVLLNAGAIRERLQHNPQTAVNLSSKTIWMARFSMLLMSATFAGATKEKLLVSLQRIAKTLWQEEGHLTDFERRS